MRKSSAAYLMFTVVGLDVAIHQASNKGKKHGNLLE
jgi:hypothetical protein